MSIDDIRKLFLGIPKLFNKEFKMYLHNLYWCAGKTSSYIHPIYVNGHIIYLCHGWRTINERSFTKMWCNNSQLHALKSFLSQFERYTKNKDEIQIALSFRGPKKKLYTFHSLDEILIKIDMNDVE